MTYTTTFDSSSPYALEIEVGSMRVAWTEDDEVYVLAEGTKEKSIREDGFMLIGRMAWESDNREYWEEEAINLERLQEFALNWKQTKGE